MSQTQTTSLKCTKCGITWTKGAKLYRFRDGMSCANPDHMKTGQPLPKTQKVKVSDVPAYLIDLKRINYDLLAIAKSQTLEYFGDRQVSDDKRDIQTSVLYKGLLSLYIGRETA